MQQKLFVGGLANCSGNKNIILNYEATVLGQKTVGHVQVLLLQLGGLVSLASDFALNL